MADAARAVASEVLGRLNDAWNAGDGAAFAGWFSEDADVINIYGSLIQGPRYAGGPHAVHL
jgi:uncharacterized protein (TIGR02246 family)